MNFKNLIKFSPSFHCVQKLQHKHQSSVIKSQKKNKVNLKQPSHAADLEKCRLWLTLLSKAPRVSSAAASGAAGRRIALFWDRPCRAVPVPLGHPGVSPRGSPSVGATPPRVLSWYQGWGRRKGGDTDSRQPPRWHRWQRSCAVTRPRNGGRMLLPELLAAAGRSSCDCRRRPPLTPSSSELSSFGRGQHPRATGQAQHRLHWRDTRQSLGTPIPIPNCTHPLPSMSLHPLAFFLPQCHEFFILDELQSLLMTLHEKAEGPKVEQREMIKGPY